MKLTIFAILILMAAADVKYQVRQEIAEEWDKLYEPYKQECIQKSGVNEDDVQNLYQRGYYPNKTEFKCYLNCVGIKLGYITDDGNLNDVVLQRTTSTTTADLDTLEHSMKAVEDIKDPCEKFYMYIITAVSKAAIRYPPRTKNIN